MQVQLACVLFLCVTCGGICSELDSDQRTLTQEILSSLFSKMRQSKQSAPFWRVSLSTLCRLVTSVDDEGWSQERADQEVEQEEAELSEAGPVPLTEELYGLRLLCRMLQNREQRLQSDSMEFQEESPEVPLKRKYPYILKRQTQRPKSRRPYILKRSPVY
ncbi:neurotensin/neuromedin N [Periophthalmus magnuspinnatus]|uniref:neurotensin/neuromedin N n=1 Tax=Periophthalmus magnuspinnatus TaxID=409849 RepID=UPI00145A49BE|nr:neurotensin/neuromedin N [Periophthalmus magnuspinnatus]